MHYSVGVRILTGYGFQRELGRGDVLLLTKDKSHETVINECDALVVNKIIAPIDFLLWRREIILQ